MKGKTPVVLLTVGALLLLFGGAMGVMSRMKQRAVQAPVEFVTPQAAAKSIIVNATAPVKQAAPAPVVSSVHPAISQQDLDSITAELRSDSADDRRNAVAQMRALAESDAKSLSQGIPAWIGPMLDDRLFTEVEELSVRAIIARSSLPTLVEAAQHGRVMAYIGEGNFPRALKEAKGYYNVAAFQDTADTVQLLSQVLTKTNGAAAAAQFQSEQASPAVSHIGIIKTIAVDASPFTAAITDLDQNGQGRHSYNHIAQGNLLLLTDKPEEARKCFVEACKIAKGDKNVRDAVEGVARAMRAADGNVANANAFILSLREDPAKAGSELVPPSGAPTPNDIQSAAQRIMIAEVQ